MASSAASGSPPAVPRPSSSVAFSATMPMSEPEADERELEATPPLDRSVFLYLEPRSGLDGRGYFAQCASCSNFVPEAFMRGAARGDRCALLGSQFPVTDDSSCGLYTPWASGVPCEPIVAHNAGELVAGLRGAVAPSEAGFVPDTRVRCRNCRFVDADGDGTGAPECEFMEGLNAALPKVFALDKKVSLDGCCNAFSEILEVSSD